MKKLLLTLSAVLCVELATADSFYDSLKVIKSDGSTLIFPIALVDEVVSDEEVQNILLTIPKSEIKEIITPEALPAESVDLTKDGEKTYFNTLRSISFKDKNGQTLVAKFGNDNSTSIMLPPLAKYSDFITTFDTDGSYIYVNGKLIENGSELTISSSTEIKIVSFLGEVQTYKINLYNSNFPTVWVMSPSNGLEITSDWNEGFALRTFNSDGSLAAENIVEFRGRGGSFSNSGNDKYAYGIKFDKKTSPLNMPNGKRWILLPCKADKTLLRTVIGFDIYKKYLASCWTPTYAPCELIINDFYKGCYLLVEQVRVADERIAEGVIISVENEEDDDDDFFRSKRSNTLFVFHDPDAGSIGTRLIRTQKLIDEFEALLFSGSDSDRSKALKMIDLNSFADWIVINEIAKNGNAFLKDSYLNISSDYLLKMGPIWDMSDFFGNSVSDQPNGFVAANTVWAAELLKDPDFKKLVYDRFEIIYSNKAEILQMMEQKVQDFRISANGNERVHNIFGLANSAQGEQFENEYLSEINRLKAWLEERLEWLHNYLN